MRKDVLELHAFYDSLLGETARGFIAERLADAWGAARSLRVAGFGYAAPYLSAFSEAERVLSLAPDAQGVMAGEPGRAGDAALVEEGRWPIADAALDRLLIVHGLEETEDPQRLMREVWRVLAGDGRAIIVVAHRRGLWSAVETTPFAAGRPYLKRQLDRLLQSAMLRAVAWSSALYFPPFDARFLLGAANAWERAGARLWPGLGGVVMVEAVKDLVAPVATVRRRRAPALRPAGAIAAARLDDATNGRLYRAATEDKKEQAGEL